VSLARLWFSRYLVLGGVLAGTIVPSVSSSQKPGGDPPVVAVPVRAVNPIPNPEIQLHATGVSNPASDVASVTISTASIEPIQVNTHDVNPGASVPRDQCLTVAVGDNAAYECGDLRLVHPLPSTTTMGTTRTPMLLRTSHYQWETRHLAADVTLTGITTDSIRVRIRVPDRGVTPDQVFNWDPAWNGQTRRIVMPFCTCYVGSVETGAYHYELEVSTKDMTYTAQDTATFVVVNRYATQFGFNWWLDGLEQLNFNTPHPTEILWIGGDGSTRLYARDTTVTADSVWVVRPALDRPDTLTKQNGVYVRHLRNGARVEFDQMGQQTATVNSRGHRTTFGYVNGVLDSIALPVPAAAPPRVYKFSYAANPTRLSRVTAPSVPGQPPREVIITDTTGFAGLAYLTGITDPDGQTTHFGWTIVALTSRTDKSGHVTRFDFDGDNSSNAFIKATIEMGSPTTDIVHSFCPAEFASLLTCALGPQDTANVRTLVDGPRSDVADTTAFYLTSFGAPRKIVNALGESTTIEREDARWAVLPTAVVDANDHRVEATYTDRGLVETMRDLYPLGGDSIALTQYQWHGTWDKVESITGPKGEVVRVGYFANGDREWQEDGRGPLSHVNFTYTADRQVQTVSTPGNADNARTQFHYDALGNLDSTTSPVGIASRIFRDAIGRDTLIRTPIDAAQTQYVVRAIEYDIRDLILGEEVRGPAVSYALTLRGGVIPPVLAETLRVTTDYDEEGHVLAVTRVPIPDTLGVQGATRAYGYDAAGRRTMEDGDFFTYDPAGNLTERRTRRGYTVRMEYDAVNRLRKRTVPEVRAPGRCLHEFSTSCSVAFPLYPNDGASGLLIPEDIAEFFYDRAGRLTRAVNGDAEILRGYSLSGLLLGDTLRIRSSDWGVASSEHIVRYGYDLSGRRTALTDPAGNTTTYQYLPQTNFLETVLDPAGVRFGFAYDSAGRTARKTVTPAGAPSATLTDSLRYDADSRLTWRREWSSILGTLHDETLQYDARDKIVRADAYVRDGNKQQIYQQVYSGLGTLVASLVTNPPPDAWLEEWRADAMGNIAIARIDRLSSPGVERRSIYDGEWLISTIADSAATARLGELQSGMMFPDSTMYAYDQVGNTTRVETRQYYFQQGQIARGPLAHWVDHASWYGADEKLRVAERYDTYFEPGDLVQQAYARRGTYEEYRYDALGRRVLRRERRARLCVHPQCRDMVTAFVWAGDELIAESGLRSMYYVLGPTLDQPLKIAEYSTALATGIVPHATWRGLYSSGTTVQGTRSDCSLGPSDQSNCIQIGWPAHFLGMYLNAGPNYFPEWFGSAVNNHRDGTGLSYRRNRYYDAESGRFTQEDAIGLAGGMNLYGYAGGDPVNFDDPFGLDCKDRDGKELPEKSCHPEDKPLETPLVDPVAIAAGYAAGALVAATTRAATVEVVHFTSVEGAAAIEQSGALRANSFVALPGQVAGKIASVAESFLEVAPGRGAMSARFRVPVDVLKTPFNGAVTSGGATQFQVMRQIPLKPGSFIPTP
jgi:RHS repeat-associated protein